jgi:hypothetical protein
MTDQAAERPHCFNCNRLENDIPLIAWRYQGAALWTCSECMPLLIHKWPQIATGLDRQDYSKP